MTQVSKRFIPKKTYKKIFDIFLETLSSFKDKNSISSFLGDFLTPSEQIMLTKRFSVAFLIAKGLDYREISRILKVSTSTVTRVASNYRNSQYIDNAIKKILEKEEIEKFWLELGDEITGIFSKAGSKSGSWKILNKEIKDKKFKKPF